MVKYLEQDNNSWKVDVFYIIFFFMPNIRKGCGNKMKNWNSAFEEGFVIVFNTRFDDIIFEELYFLVKFLFYFLICITIKKDDELNFKKNFKFVSLPIFTNFWKKLFAFV